MYTTYEAILMKNQSDIWGAFLDVDTVTILQATEHS